MATRGGKTTREDTPRATPRAKSAPSKKLPSSQAATPSKGHGVHRTATTSAQPVTPSAAPVQKPAAVRTRKVSAPAAAQPAAVAPSPDQKRRMIEVAAYLRAERAGFGSTNPEQDWIEAECEVEQALAKRQL